MLWDRILQLHKKKAKYTEREAQYLAHIMFEALEYMHGMHIVHRDIKPGILFDKLNIFSILWRKASQKPESLTSRVIGLEIK